MKRICTGREPIFLLSLIIKISIFCLGKLPPKIRCPLGCYKDSGRRILPKSFVNLSRNTPWKCARHCNQEGYSLSGVQYRTQCFCGRSLPRRAYLIPSSKCNMKCPRNKNKICGGTWAMNVSRLRIGRGKKCR